MAGVAEVAVVVGQFVEEFLAHEGVILGDVVHVGGGGYVAGAVDHEVLGAEGRYVQAVVAQRGVVEIGVVEYFISVAFAHFDSVDNVEDVEPYALGGAGGCVFRAYEQASFGHGAGVGDGFAGVCAVHVGAEFGADPEFGVAFGNSGLVVCPAVYVGFAACFAGFNLAVAEVAELFCGADEDAVGGEGDVGEVFRGAFAAFSAGGGEGFEGCGVEDNDSGVVFGVERQYVEASVLVEHAGYGAAFEFCDCNVGFSVVECIFAACAEAGAFEKVGIVGVGYCGGHVAFAFHECGGVGNLGSFNGNGNGSGALVAFHGEFEGVVAGFYVAEHECAVELVVGGVGVNCLVAFLEGYQNAVEGFVYVVVCCNGHVCVVAEAFVLVAYDTVDVAYFLFFNSEEVGDAVCVVEAFHVVHVPVHVAECCGSVLVEVSFDEESGYAVLEHAEVAFISAGCG